MRTITLLALLLAVAQLYADKAPAFEEGKKYHYLVKSRTATGVGDQTHQFSTFGYTAKLMIQNAQDNVVFQLQDIKVGTLNDKIDHMMEETEMSYNKPTGEQGKFVQEIEKPFWVKFDNGMVKSIYFSKNDHTPDGNVKKAIATLFNVNLKTEGVPDPDMYMTKEDGIGGECDTLYQIGHYPDMDSPDADVMNVTKIRKYEKCSHRPHILHTSFMGQMCRECSQQNFKPLRNVAQVSYGMKGNRDHYTIETIRSSGAIVLTPFTPNGQTIMSITNQTMILVKVEDATPMPKPGDAMEIQSLSYTFNDDHRDTENVNLKEAHYGDRIYDREFPDRMKEAEKWAGELRQAMIKFEKGAKPIAKLVTKMQKFSYDDFEQFFAKNVDQDEKMKHIMMEIIPLVGTNPSILYMMHMIETGKIPDPDISKMIRKVPIHVKEPSYTLLMKMKEFGNTEKIMKNKKLFADSRLAFGTMVFRACVEDQFNPHPVHSKTYIPAEKCAAIVQVLIEKFKSSQDKMERSVYLRAIQNTRTEDAFKFLCKVLKGHEYEVLLRQSAMWGLYPFIEKHPMQVARVMYPIMADVYEDYVLRIYAFELILYSHPSTEFFSSLVLLLNRERNQKLTSYIYSSLHTFANSTDPCHQQFTMHAKRTIQFMEHMHRDIIKHSTNRILSIYNAKYNYGRSTQLVMIPSNHSVFPRELYMKQSMNVFGINFDIFEIGYNAEGKSTLEMILGREMGPSGLHDYGQELKNDDLQEVVNKLHLKNSIHTDMGKYEVYMKMFNQETFVTRDLIEDIKARFKGSSEMSYKDGKLTMDVHSVTFVEGEYIIPNEMGLPVSMKVQIPAIHCIEGTAQINMKEDDSTHRKKGMTADLNMRLAADFSVMTRMVLKTKMFDHYGYAMHTKGGMKLPLKGSIDVDMITKKTAITYIPSIETYDMMYYTSMPYTVGKEWMPIHYDSKPTNRQYRAGHDFFGVGFNWNFTYVDYWNDFGSYRQYMKSFLRKSIGHGKYFYLSDKLYAAMHGFCMYASMNPTAKPFSLNVRFEPSTSNPTTEFSLVTKREFVKKYEGNRGQVVYKYLLDLVGKGSAERKWRLEFHSSMNWPERDSRKVLLNYQRSPLPNYDSKGYEVCYQRTTTYNEWARVFTTFPSDLKMNYNGQLTMGTKCDDPDARKILIKGVGEKSEKQLNMDRTSLPMYKKCQEYRKRGDEMNNYCWNMIKDNGRMDKFTFDIVYKNIPENVKGYFYRAYTYFRHLFYDNLELLPMEGSNEENHIKITANFSYYHPVLDVKIVRPHETVKYNRIFVPSILPQWKPFTVAEPMIARMAKRIFNYHRPICTISSKYIDTFDDVRYKAALGDCYYLAFADAKDHHIHVLYRAMKGNSKFSKAMKVFFDNDEIEIIPEGDHLMIKINGEEKMKGKSAYIQEHDNKIDFGVYKVYGQRHMISSRRYGVSIMFDGEKGYIQASNFYRGKQRGLCGNFDGEIVDEFEGANGKIYHNIQEFVKSYGVQTGGCSMP